LLVFFSSFAEIAIYAIGTSFLVFCGFKGDVGIIDFTQSLSESVHKLILVICSPDHK